MKKTNFSSKLLAFVLCIVLAVGLLPTSGLALDNTSNAPLSMALVLDNSFAAYEYNTIGDNSWLDAYAGLMEQAPSGSTFAVITPDGTASPTGLDAAQEALYNLPLFTSTEASAASLLTEAAQALSGSSGQKMVVLSSASCYNNSELQSQISTLASQGIDVRVVASERDAQRIAAVEAAYENVVVCRDVRELPILLGDWYAELAELPAAPVMQPNSVTSNSSGKTYNSSFRTCKHKYRFLTADTVEDLDLTPQQKQGIALSELLNIYYFLPSWATSDSGGYHITDGMTCQWIGKGNMYNAFQTLSDAQSLIDFWGGQAERLLHSDCAVAFDPDKLNDMRKIVVENLKRRMPVLAFTNDDAYLIYSYTESTGKLGLFGTDGEKTDGYLQNYNFTIVDTGKYFNLQRSGMYISDEQSGNANTKTVTISLPDGYTDADQSVQSYKKTDEDAYETMAYTSFANGTVTYQAGQDTEFVVGVRVIYNGITPNCYNATRNYIIKIYPDVHDGQWFASYVFDMSNQGLLVGGENNGVFGFWPDDPITIAEFLTVIYRAADIKAKIHNNETNQDEDVTPYSVTMAKHALLEQWINEEQYQQVLYGIGALTGQAPRGIWREEAADMLWKVFCSDECRVPHQLYEYDESTAPASKKTQWLEYADTIEVNGETVQWAAQHSSYSDSFYQLFLNGVIAGYANYGENGKDMLLPQATITRAETCKIVSKALYSLSEIGTTLDPIWEGNYTELQLGTPSSGNLSSYGGKNYSVEIGQAGYYMVSTTADKYALYDAGGTRMEPVDAVDGKDVYMVTNAQELRLYTSGSSGADVATTVENAPSGYIAPVKLHFTKDPGTAEKPHYYLFDDNIEFITLDHVADNGDASTTIAHFGNLGVGKYTFFGYHNRNDTFTGNHLYYDPVFWNSAGTSGSVKITKVGADPVGWKWNQVWADFSGEEVLAEKFYELGDLNPYPITYSPQPENYISLPWDFAIGENSKTWFSQFLSPGQIEEMMGGCWIIFEFEVTSGTVNFDTLAYQDPSSKNNINLPAIAKGNYYNDLQNPTIKGKSDYAPVVSTELSYVVDSTTVSDETVLPVKVVNQFHPDGYQNAHNVFTTRVNSYGADGAYTNWISADDSNMLPFYYIDDGGSGKAWIFDPTHDCVTGEVFPTPETGPVEGVNRAHLANFGVTEKYKINLYNPGETDRLFSYRIEAQGFYVYKVNVMYDGVEQTGEKYNRQLFRYAYMDSINKNKEEEEDTICTYEYIDIPLPAGKTTVVELEVTLTTGCNMTAHNSLVIDRDTSIERYGDV